MTEASDALEDLVGGFRPHERLGPPVSDLDVPADGRLQLARTAMQPAAKLLLGQRREQALDEIDPRRASRREVRVDTGLQRKPAMTGRRLVGARWWVRGERSGTCGG